LSATAISVLCHKRPNAPQQKAPLFDHLVGTREQRRRHVETGWEGFAERDLWNAGFDHSGLMLAVRITLAHLSGSS